MKKIKILTFNGYYKPGYKGGGPIKSIANMAASLNEEFEFYIVTSDRDYEDSEPYNGIQVDDWNEIDYEKVYYHSDRTLSYKKFLSTINSIEADIIYLNGYYINYTRMYLVLKKLRLVKDKPTILCPRGDFTEGEGNSLIKKLKKNVYIYVMKLLRMNNNLVWHATSLGEEDGIKRIIGKEEKILSASNIPNLPQKNEQYLKKEIGSVNLVYISRINRKKNLLFALKLLHEVKGNVSLDIYGPVFDESYWNECKKEIEKLPPNITVNILGSIDSSLVIDTFSKSHFFLFPTNGENYGHIIYESFCGGCPVIISNMTPWKNLSNDGVGWDIPLKEEKEYKQRIQECVDMNEENYNKMRATTNLYAQKTFDSDVSVNLTRKMFFNTLEKNRNYKSTFQEELKSVEK